MNEQEWQKWKPEGCPNGKAFLSIFFSNTSSYLSPILDEWLVDAIVRDRQLAQERDVALEAKQRAEEDLQYVRYRHGQEKDEAR